MYFIGDLQGCNLPFQRLLAKVDFSASRDTLYMLGDQVNRGPDSLGALRSLAALGDSAKCLLGNHDLHLLAVWQGTRKPGRKDTLQAILDAADRDMLMDWLRNRSMAMHAHGWLMVHAGVLPQWDLQQTLALALEVEIALRGPDMKAFLGAMYGNLPDKWSDQLQDADRLRVIVNALTRLRFCTADGKMEFENSGAASAAPAGFQPWFDVAGRKTADIPIAFGHWSTLMTETNDKAVMHNNALALDTGCVWGGCLTAARLGARPGDFEIVQLQCEQASKPN